MLLNLDNQMTLDSLFAGLMIDKSLEPKRTQRNQNLISNKILVTFPYTNKPDWNRNLGFFI
jgi:hypothetical protein